MSSNELYTDKQLDFGKVASIAQLSTQVTNWTQEVLTELYRYLPFLNKYEVIVRIDQVDPERGYGMGYAEVQNSTKRTAKEKTTGGDINFVRIPIFIRNKKLEPFDVFMHKETAQPLTEERFTKALNRLETFDSAKNTPPVYDSLLETLYPPDSSRAGGFSGNSMIKSASFPLLETAMKTASTAKYKSMLTKIGDRDLQAPIAGNAAMCQAVKVILDYNPPEKVATKLAEMLIPDVVQIRRKADGDYLIKSASHSAFDIQEVAMSADDLASKFPGLPAIAVDTTHIIGTGLKVSGEDTWAKHGGISEPGFYKVANSRGGEKSGSVFSVVNLDNRDTGKWLFTDGNGYSLQKNMVGEKVANFKGYVEDYLKPGVTGVLCFEKQGAACATPPFTVNNVSILEDRESFHCTSGLSKMTFSFDTTGMLKQAAKNGDNYTIPRDYKFMAIAGKNFEAVSASYQLDNFEKVASARMGITIYNRGGHFLLEGEPLKKLAGYNRMTTRPETEFLLVAAGVHPLDVGEKLAQADKRLKSKVQATRVITPMADVQGMAEKTAAKKMANALPAVKDVMADTVKLAAAINDMVTLDGLLALNFVTPNNLAIYAGMLPAFEAIQSRVAELLMASRLGMNELPGNALRMAMKQLEKVIIALRGIKVGTDSKEKIK